MKRRPYSPFMSYHIMHNITPKLLQNKKRIQMSKAIYKILIKDISYEKNTDIKDVIWYNTTQA